MRVIDLTLPLYEGMPFSNTWPQEAEFKIEPITDWETGGARLDVYTIFCEQGTRRVLYSFDAFLKDGPHLEDDEANIVMQDAVVVDIPKRPREVVTPEEIEEATAKADYRKGDILLIRTGWGDNERWRKMKDEYELASPHFGRDDTCKKLTEIMIAKKTRTFCYDTANMSDMAALYKDWLEMKPRPKPWPSPEAKARMQKRIQDRMEMNKKMGPEGIGIYRVIRAKISLLGGLINCGKIKKERIKLIALPIKVEGVAMAPCRVVAIEE